MSRPDLPDQPTAETAAAAELRQHLEEVARDRDQAYRALQEREAELARIQRIGMVGGMEVDLRDGFRNRRSPEYLMIHGLPPEAAHETHQEWLQRVYPEDRVRNRAALRRRDQEQRRRLYRRIPYHPPE